MFWLGKQWKIFALCILKWLEREFERKWVTGLQLITEVGPAKHTVYLDAKQFAHLTIKLLINAISCTRILELLHSSRMSGPSYASACTGGVSRLHAWEMAGSRYHKTVQRADPYKKQATTAENMGCCTSLAKEPRPPGAIHWPWCKPECPTAENYFICSLILRKCMVELFQKHTADTHKVRFFLDHCWWSMEPSIGLLPSMPRF